MSDRSIDNFKLASSLEVCEIDLLLILIVSTLIKSFGHRYGSVIEAVSTAAKFAVYSTYLEQGKNLRRTGFIHHVEPRRVKEIVKEFEVLMVNNLPLNLLGGNEPQYLIGVPYLWLELYPREYDESVFKLFPLTEQEKFIAESSLPYGIPEALAITDAHLSQLVQVLHEKSVKTQASRKQPSFALIEHSKFKLLESGTIAEIKLPSYDLSAYVLTRTDYSPKGKQAKSETMIQDLIRYFKLLNDWVNNDPIAMRGIETLELDPSQKAEALKELDELIREWADKYHQNGAALPIALQFALGISDV